MILEQIVFAVIAIMTLKGNLKAIQKASFLVFSGTNV